MAQKSCMAQPVGRWLLHATSQIQSDCKGQQCAHSLEPGGNIGRKTPRIWISLLPSLSTLLSHLPFFLCSMPFLSFSGVLTGLDVLMCVTLKRRKRPPNRQMSESPASVTVCSQVRLRSSSYCSLSSNWYCLQTYNFNVTTGSLDTHGQSLYREKLGCPR